MKLEVLIFFESLENILSWTPSIQVVMVINESPVLTKWQSLIYPL